MPQNHAYGFVKCLKNAAVAAVYTTTFILIYKFYLNPVFEYAHYYSIERGFLALLTAATMSVIPVFFYRGLKSISSFIAIFIYAITYVPTVITLPMALTRDIYEIFVVQFALMFGMSLFFAADRFASGQSLKVVKTKLPMYVVHAMTLLFTVSVLNTYSGSMRFVSFEDVYELRFENTELQMNVVIGYMVMWLTYCLYPFYLSMGLVTKRWTYFVLATMGSALIYMSTGAKSGLLLPVILICVYLIIRMRGDLFRNLVLTLSGVSLCLLILGADDNLLAYWARSLLFARTLGNGGWVSYTYYEFFTEHQFTYFSHVNVINYLTGGYPYGALSLGQVIGIQYAGSESANFNAHFWASDGIAALGVAGIYIMNVVVLLLLIVLNLITSRLEIRFLCVWFTGFVLALLNLPFSTALLSGGGLLIILLLLFVRIRETERIPIPYPHPSVRAEPACP